MFKTDTVGSRIYIIDVCGSVFILIYVYFLSLSYVLLSTDLQPCYSTFAVNGDGAGRGVNNMFLPVYPSCHILSADAASCNNFMTFEC